RRVDLAAHPGEAQLGRGRGREALLTLEELLDVEPVAGVRRHTTRRGVWMSQEAFVLERGELGSHGRGTPVDVRAVRERARADRTPVVYEALDHQPEDHALTFCKYRTDCRNGAGRSRRVGCPTPRRG